MKQEKLTAEQQLEKDKKHLRLIALNWRPSAIANELMINTNKECYERGKLYYIYDLEDTRETVVFALQHGIITLVEAAQTLSPSTSVINWRLVKDI